MITTVAILVGGKGTRLASFLGGTPKPLALVAGTPFLELLIAKLSQAGALKIYLLTGYRADDFEKYNNFKYGATLVKCVRESEPLGSAGALLNAQNELFSDNFILLNGDTFLDIDYRKLLEVSLPQDFDMGLGLCQVEDAGRYGSVRKLENGKVVEFLEKGKSGSGHVNAGVFLVTKKILETIKQVEADKNKKFLTLENDIFPILVKTERIYSFNIDGNFVDIGIPESYCTFNVNAVLYEALKAKCGFFLAQILIALFEGRKIVGLIEDKQSNKLFSFLEANGFFRKVSSVENRIFQTLEEEDLVINTLDSEAAVKLSTRAFILPLAEQTTTLLKNNLNMLSDDVWVNTVNHYWKLIEGCRGYVRRDRKETTPAMFLDRDGVVINYIPYIKNPEDVVLQSRINEVISWARKKKWPVVMVTNQAGIEKGRYTEKEFVAVQNNILSNLAVNGAWIDRIYDARFFNEGNTYFSLRAPQLRKPSTGMLTKAKSDFNIQFDHSVFIGDSEADIKAGLGVGIGRIIILKSGIYSENEWQRLVSEYKGRVHFFDNLTNVMEFLS